MRAARFINTNNSIESYHLEEYHNHHKRMDEIESTKSGIYKNIESNKLITDLRYQMLQHTSKFKESQAKLRTDKLLSILENKIEVIRNREFPFKTVKRSRAQSQADMSNSILRYSNSMENMNLLRKLSQLKPNISKKSLDEQYEKQKAVAQRLRKFHKLPSLF